MERISTLLHRANMHDRVAESSPRDSFTARHHRALARRRRLQADLLEIRMRERARAAELI